MRLPTPHAEEWGVGQHLTPAEGDAKPHARLGSTGAEGEVSRPSSRNTICIGRNQNRFSPVKPAPGICRPRYFTVCWPFASTAVVTGTTLGGNAIDHRVPTPSYATPTPERVQRLPRERTAPPR